ncbi:MAG: MBL fold metallo-hydrolase [Candidatus Aminicenantes bacterium]|jgi:glyoxylase-like metal-dependent hydrolase (beta-lactamase superfamily II)
MKKEIKFEPVGDGIYVIETYYLNRTGFTACYLMEDKGEVAMIETNTNHAVPFILGTLEQLGLSKEQVKYVILTHIHLDHAGGSGELMKHLPQAELILHPRGRKHIINPEKLIKSVKAVYGETKYKKLYGDIVPVPKERVQTANDGDELRLGSRGLQVFDLRGHAKHHLVVLDKKTRALFSGDNFGIGYPRLDFGRFRLVFPSTSPTQFEPNKALETYQRIVDLEPSRILLTHYGVLEDIDGTHTQLNSWIEFSVEIAEKEYAQGYRDDELADILERELWTRFEEIVTDTRGEKLSPEEKEWLTLDTKLNAQGLVHYIQKRNAEAGQQ